MIADQNAFSRKNTLLESNLSTLSAEGDEKEDVVETDGEERGVRGGCGGCGGAIKQRRGG
jgi:hypothetical protein